MMIIIIIIIIMMMIGYPRSGSRCAVYAHFSTFAVVQFLFNTCLVSAVVLKSVNIDLELSRVARRVDERFLSVTIDASLIAKEKFMYLLGSPKLRILTKALTPAFLRFGGTQQDFMKFKPQSKYYITKSYSGDSHPHAGPLCSKFELPPVLEEELKQGWAIQALLLRHEDAQGKCKQVTFSGLELIFGLNALLRTPENAWDSQNAELLLNYCERQQYRMSWELGNEPNSYEKKAEIRVNGSQLGEDFLHLRKILQKSELYSSSDLYGPDIGQPRDHGKYLLTGFLETGAQAIDACTWHHYYISGRDASLEEFLDPKVLDMLAVKADEVLKIVHSLSPGKKVWLGETSSAYGGGAVSLSDTFVAGFMWLDKLGLAAKLGLDVVMRQVLIGSGTYHLVDNNLDPLPDYWLSLLYKRLVGPEVLKIQVLSSTGRQMQNSVKAELLRVYLHCTNKKSSSYRKGAVTLFALNLSKKQVLIKLPALVSNSTVEAFVLQSAEPGKEGLQSRSVRLNGDVLKMVDERTLPPLEGAELPPGEHIKLPALSFAFYVLKQAAAPVC
ncbi:heparanase isoform X2 [Neoarius graeffei]|uniref:heparanase isoform X2 n=1 Tax=Neoarius graeffei TaxID=443677 RepID=UPI00298CE79E|nr:heparanase isoform X2 [Neoarius graeffei]